MAQHPLDLDGRVFDMVSSTASRVDPDAPTRFRYRERDGLVWGEYEGDTVRLGRFVGTREGAVLTVSFAHVPVSGGGAATGSATSRIEDQGGVLVLVEDFELGGEAQRSTCREVR